MPLTVRPEAEEPVFLGKAVGPVFFRYFVARGVLTAAAAGARPARQGRTALSGIGRTVLFHKLLDEVGPLQDHAPPRRLAGDLAEVPEKRRIRSSDRRADGRRGSTLSQTG